MKFKGGVLLITRDIFLDWVGPTFQQFAAFILDWKDKTVTISPSNPSKKRKSEMNLISEPPAKKPVGSSSSSIEEN